MSKFTSQLITPDDVINEGYFFNIPIYQRLYVWGKEQIHTLLDDLTSAFKDQKDTFYLGATLVIERSDEAQKNTHHKLYDLIDGQQRFTTLWLISLVLKGALQDYLQMGNNGDLRFRIDFAIRPQVKIFLEKKIRNENINIPEAQQLEDALQEIQSYFDNYSNLHSEELKRYEFAKFIRSKVKLLLTTVPPQIDLNKLFEVINNRGVQLQHHEILKAKLLAEIDKNQREPYALLWDACANMDNYIERNLRQIKDINTVDLYKNESVDSRYNVKRESLANPDKVIEALSQQQIAANNQPTKLTDILATTQVFTLDKNAVDGEKLENNSVSSIISFSMLLQHCLRIYLHHDYEGRDIDKISDKDLLSIFSNHWLNHQPDGEKVKNFIKLLWRIRYLFDKHVVKWLSDEEERVLAIRSVTIVEGTNNNKYLQRQSSYTAPDFTVLQSMLYHSQQMTTQYWLTPFLNFVLKCDEKQAETYLRHLDNQLFCSNSNDILIKRTKRYLDKPWFSEALINPKDAFNYAFDNGTQYPHYWFYKLEFMLYLKNKNKKLKSGKPYRMTAKNSVEHVAAQNPEDAKDKIGDSLLHGFGNLALVTRSLNSEMSNKAFSIKKAEFLKRHDGYGVSFKLEDIYKNDHWGEKEIKQHQNDMIDVFKAYLGMPKTDDESKGDKQ